MTTPSELHTLPLPRLAQRCAEESTRFFNRRDNDPRFCYEIFRRAIVGQDSEAWERVYRQYRPLVTGWVERHASFPALGDEAQFFVNGAFTKMWQVMTPEKFAKFPELKHVLRYLQMCVHSVLVDAARAREQNLPLDEVQLNAQHLVHANSNPVEALALAHTQGEALWQELNQRLKDDKERQVVYGCFVLALKPSQLLQQFGGMFENVQEIYRVKENLLVRLRRDEELRALFFES